MIKIDGLGPGFRGQLQHLLHVTIHQFVGITLEPLLPQGSFQPLRLDVSPFQYFPCVYQPHKCDSRSKYLNRSFHFCFSVLAAELTVCLSIYSKCYLTRLVSTFLEVLFLFLQIRAHKILWKIGVCDVGFSYWTRSKDICHVIQGDSLENTIDIYNKLWRKLQFFYFF